MNATGSTLDLDAVVQPLNVELLSEEELRSIEGGSYLMPALVLVGAAGGAALIGVAVGVAVYYFTR